jgi:hypothetical protein
MNNKRNVVLGVDRDRLLEGYKAGTFDINQVKDTLDYELKGTYYALTIYKREQLDDVLKHQLITQETHDKFVADFCNGRGEIVGTHRITLNSEQYDKLKLL